MKQGKANKANRSGEAPLLASNVERAIREREEERAFREAFRARLRPVSVDRPRTAESSSQLPVVRSSSALPFPTVGTANTPNTPSAFTAAVMARISAPVNTSESAENENTSETPSPEVSPAMPLASFAMAGGRTFSSAMLAQQARTLFGAYGLAACIVLLSGALFAFFAPGLVFTGLNALLDMLVVVIVAAGTFWQTANTLVGGVGLLYLGLLLLLAPMLALALQARAGVSRRKA
ncbi:MAG TPA: hypothetical protein VKQ36_15980 [Ktedonobacterales bacterium]|nr:hypothetical protein [Ktedonobacterales bacterium]